MKRAVSVTALLAVSLAAACLAGLTFGSAHLSAGQIWAVLRGRGEQTAQLILFGLRLPRVIGAAMAGAALAVSGLLLQSATGNDLCSPSTIGVNAGAGLAVMALLCLAPLSYALLPFAAFSGAMLTTLAVLGIGFAVGGHSPRTTVLLAGIAVSALLNAGISFFSQLYPDVLGSYAAFSAGGFSGVQAADLPAPAAMTAAGLAAAWALSPRLNLLCLGDELARSLGVRVRALRLTSLALASVLCAAAVTYAGLLGFVGLVAPHITRRLAGSDVRALVPAAALLGASLVVLADLAARTLFTPAELPAGILLAAMGAPFFLALLFKRRHAL